MIAGLADEVAAKTAILHPVFHRHQAHLGKRQGPSGATKVGTDALRQIKLDLYMPYIHFDTKGKGKASLQLMPEAKAEHTMRRSSALVTL